MLHNPLGKVVPKCANYGVNWEGTCIACSKTENSDRKYTPAQRVHPLGKILTPWSRGYTIIIQGWQHFNVSTGNNRKYTPAQRVHPIGKILTPWSRGYTIVHWQNSEHKLKQTMSVRQSVSPSICQSIRPSARPFSRPPILWADTCIHAYITNITYIPYITIHCTTIHYVELY